MTNVARAKVSIGTIAGAAETTLLLIPIPLLAVDQPVAINWLARVLNPGQGTTKQTGRVRRGGLTGVQVDVIDDLANIAKNALNLYEAISPAVDTPGLPATVTYTLTLQMVGANKPSSGIEAFLYVTYD